MADITLPAVFLAGLASFLSPCVLPLVPPYLTYLAGATIDEISGDTVDRMVRRRAVTSALFFMAGLGTGVWDSTDDLRETWQLDRCFEPDSANASSRADGYRRWQDAVERSKGWA